MSNKIVYITKHGKRGVKTIWSDTVENLVKKVFGYTLEKGWSYNKKINLNPKTADGLVSNLNKSVAETQSNLYDRDSYSISTAEEIEFFISKSKNDLEIRVI